MDNIFDKKEMIFMFQDEDIEFGFEKISYKNKIIEDIVHYTTFSGEIIKNIEELIDYLDKKDIEILETAKMIEMDYCFEAWIRDIGYGNIFDEVIEGEKIL